MAVTCLVSGYSSTDEEELSASPKSNSNRGCNPRDPEPFFKGKKLKRRICPDRISKICEELEKQPVLAEIATEKEFFSLIPRDDSIATLAGTSFFGQAGGGDGFLSHIPKPSRTLHGITGVSSQASASVNAKRSSTLAQVPSSRQEKSTAENNASDSDEEAVENISSMQDVISGKTIRPDLLFQPLELYDSLPSETSTREDPSVKLPVEALQRRVLDSPQVKGGLDIAPGGTREPDAVGRDKLREQLESGSSNAQFLKQVPKGKEWEGLKRITSLDSDFDNKSVANRGMKSLRMDDLKDPDWLRSFHLGYGRLKGKTPLGASGIKLNASLEPSRRQRQKHQINWLAADAVNREHELLEKSAQQKLTKYQTQMKYGW